MDHLDDDIDEESAQSGLAEIREFENEKGEIIGELIDLSHQFKKVKDLLNSQKHPEGSGGTGRQEMLFEKLQQSLNNQTSEIPLDVIPLSYI
jgi:carbamoylphosphate synthase small subunit